MLEAAGFQPAPSGRTEVATGPGAPTSVGFGCPEHTGAPAAFGRVKPTEVGAPGLRLTEPLSYLDFTALETRAALVITDSGGVQEETSYLGVPCLTVRPNTERPVTITQGTNRLLDPEKESLSAAALAAIQAGRRPGPCRIEGWDGHAAGRVARALREMLGV